MSNLFAVFKVGVYRHECGGIFRTEALAIAAAKELHEGERDDYHHYEVVPFTLDYKTNQTTEEVWHTGNETHICSTGELVENDVIAEIGLKED
tara:strand:- start:2439 stop:2717 length:279 start_codon:yes stop_codon:yes gene_type:complete